MPPLHQKLKITTYWQSTLPQPCHCIWILPRLSNRKSGNFLQWFSQLGEHGNHPSNSLAGGPVSSRSLIKVRFGTTAQGRPLRFLAVMQIIWTARKPGVNTDLQFHGSCEAWLISAFIFKVKERMWNSSVGKKTHVAITAKPRLLYFLQSWTCLKNRKDWSGMKTLQKSEQHRNRFWLLPREPSFQNVFIWLYV